MKRLLIKLISLFEKVTRKLIRAYDATYGGEDIAILFNAEVQRRKMFNKISFIKNEAKRITQNIFDKENYVISEHRAYELAEQKFKEAQNNGELDELNSKKGE